LAKQTSLFGRNCLTGMALPGGSSPRQCAGGNSYLRCARSAFGPKLSIRFVSEKLSCRSASVNRSQEILRRAIISIDVPFMITAQPELRESIPALSRSGASRHRPGFRKAGCRFASLAADRFRRQTLLLGISERGDLKAPTNRPTRSKSRRYLATELHAIRGKTLRVCHQIST